MVASFHCFHTKQGIEVSQFVNNVNDVDVSGDSLNKHGVNFWLAVVLRRLRFRIGGLDRTYFRFPVSHDTVAIGSIGARQSGCAVRA